MKFNLPLGKFFSKVLKSKHCEELVSISINLLMEYLKITYQNCTTGIYSLQMINLHEYIRNNLLVLYYSLGETSWTMWNTLIDMIIDNLGAV